MIGSQYLPSDTSFGRSQAKLLATFLLTGWFGAKSSIPLHLSTYPCQLDLREPNFGAEDPLVTFDPSLALTF
jgi:hypothetical protein